MTRGQLRIAERQQLRSRIREERAIDGVGLTDWLYAYTAAAEYFSGLPLLDTPRPEFGTLATVKWPELMGTPGYYTERGRRFDSVVKYLSGGDVPLRLEGLLERYVQNLNPRDPGPGRPRNSRVTPTHGTSPMISTRARD